MVQVQKAPHYSVSAAVGTVAEEHLWEPQVVEK